MHSATRQMPHHPATAAAPIIHALDWAQSVHNATRPHSKAAKRISSFCTPNNWILGGKSSLGHLVEESPTFRSESLVFFVRPTASWKDIPSRAPPRVPMRQALGGSDCSINPRVLRDRGGESVENPQGGHQPDSRTAANFRERHETHDPTVHQHPYTTPIRFEIPLSKPALADLLYNTLTSTSTSTSGHTAAAPSLLRRGIIRGSRDPSCDPSRGPSRDSGSVA